MRLHNRVVARKEPVGDFPSVALFCRFCKFCDIKIGIIDICKAIFETPPH